jgi:hypothetical protein
MQKFSLFITAASVLLLGLVVLPPTMQAYSQKGDDAKLPATMTTAEENKLLDLALSKKQVQDKLKDSKYDFVGIGFFTENIDVDSPTWKPIVHLNVDGLGSMAVFLDADKKNIEKIEEIAESKLTVLATPPTTYASNYYTGGSAGVNGMRFTASAPTYSTTSSVTNTLTAFLLNAVAANADLDFLCDPGHFPSTYFAQVGFAWSTLAETVVWTDTAAGCTPQATGLSYTEGNNYEYKIYVSGTTWKIFAKNLVSGSAFTKNRTGVTWLTMKTSEFFTGAFFENQNTGTNTNWYTKYGSTSLPGSGAKFSTDGGSTWSNWQSALKKDQKCDTSRVTSTVIAGNLASGGIGTWNLQTMSGIHC